MARFLAFVVCLAMSAKASWADTGVQTPSIPRLSIYDALVEGNKRFRRTGDETQGENQFELRTGLGHSEGRLGLLLGARVAAAARTENAILSAESRVTALRHGDQSTGLRGYHRLFGLYFLGESGDEIGADITLDARFRHREGLRFRLDAPRLMGDLAYSGSTTLGATFRYASDEMALAVPLRYQFGGDEWRNSALRQVIRHRASMGIGFMPHTRERLRGAVEALQLSAEHQSFRHVSGVERTTEGVASTSSLPALTKVRVGTAMSELTVLDNDIHLVADYFFGWAWLAEEAQNPVTRNGFEMKLGARAEMTRARDHLGVGLGVARNLSRVGQTGLWASEWRTDFQSAFRRRAWAFEGAGGLSWVRPLGSSNAESPTLRMVSHVAAYRSISRMFELGAYMEIGKSVGLVGGPVFSDEAGIVLRFRTKGESRERQRLVCGTGFLRQERERHEQALRQQALREQAQQALREQAQQALREQELREQEEREQAPREQAQRERAEEEEAALLDDSDEEMDRDWLNPFLESTEQTDESEPGPVSEFEPSFGDRPRDSP